MTGNGFTRHPLGTFIVRFEPVSGNRGILSGKCEIHVTKLRPIGFRFSGNM